MLTKDYLIQTTKKRGRWRFMNVKVWIQTRYHYGGTSTLNLHSTMSSRCPQNFWLECAMFYIRMLDLISILIVRCRYRIRCHSLLRMLPLKQIVHRCHYVLRILPLNHIVKHRCHYVLRILPLNHIVKHQCHYVLQILPLNHIVKHQCHYVLQILPLNHIANLDPRHHLIPKIPLLQPVPMMFLHPLWSLGWSIGCKIREPKQAFGLKSPNRNHLRGLGHLHVHRQHTCCWCEMANVRLHGESLWCFNLVIINYIDDLFLSLTKNKLWDSGHSWNSNFATDFRLMYPQWTNMRSGFIKHSMSNFDLVTTIVLRTFVSSSDIRAEIVKTSACMCCKRNYAASIYTEHRACNYRC